MMKNTQVWVIKLIDGAAYPMLHDELLATHHDDSRTKADPKRHASYSTRGNDQT
jgi:hypothetical protein